MIQYKKAFFRLTISEEGFGRRMGDSFSPPFQSHGTSLKERTHTIQNE